MNKVETFDIIGVPSLASFRTQSYREQWYGKIQELLDDGVKVWTTAHITLQSNLKATRFENLKKVTIDLIENIDEIANEINNTTNIEEVFKILLKQYGFGPFIIL